MEFFRSFLRRQFARKPVVASRIEMSAFSWGYRENAVKYQTDTVCFFFVVEPPKLENIYDWPGKRWLHKITLVGVISAFGLSSLPFLSFEQTSEGAAVGKAASVSFTLVSPFSSPCQAVRAKIRHVWTDWLLFRSSEQATFGMQPFAQQTLP